MTTYRVPGLVLTEHEFAVPLDHDRPDGERIAVFAREVADPDGLDRPFLVFFQGGPGSEAPRPTGVQTLTGWIARALKDFRVLLLDQRGTGRSTPVGSLPGMTPPAQADYLTRFRADSIVRDAEWIRRELGVDRWSVLGQSFGGFCVLTYLSIAPDGLREALITGGVPPVGRHVDDVYGATYERMLERNRHYYDRYVHDRARVLELERTIDAGEIVLPSGDRLTVRRFRQLGSALGMSYGPELLHSVLELPHDSPAFRHDLEAAVPHFARNPIYAIVHEACYADGCVTGWSADRLLPDAFREQPELLTGEHIYAWLFDDVGALRPLAEAAEILARHEWPRLYDEAQLRANEVPVAAAIYADDPYVERRFSEETAALVRGFRPWVTNEYLHDGLRADGERIVSRLLDLARGRA